jgi:hypothetical protein
LAVGFVDTAPASSSVSSTVYGEIAWAIRILHARPEAELGEAAGAVKASPSSR